VSLLSVEYITERHEKVCETLDHIQFPTLIRCYTHRNTVEDISRTACRWLFHAAALVWTKTGLVIIYVSPDLTLKNSTFHPWSAFVCFVRI
jgi:hypothetical protein